MTNDSPVTDLTALEGPDDWVSLYLDGVGEDPFTDAEVCHAVCAAVHLSLGLDCFALDLQLSDLPTVRPDLIDGTRSAAEPIAPVTASDRSVAQGFQLYMTKLSLPYLLTFQLCVTRLWLMHAHDVNAGVLQHCMEV